MAKISLNNIAEELAEKSNLTRDVTEGFMHAFVETIERGLHEDNIVKIKGLGTFKLQEMSDRESVDVNTGERITIKGYRKVTFTPDSTMKEFVNRPFAHFEPTELNDGYPTDDEPEIAADENDDAEMAEVVDTAAIKAMEEVTTVEVAENTAEEVTAPLQVDLEDVRNEEPEVAEELLVVAEGSSEVESGEEVETAEVSPSEDVELKQEPVEIEASRTLEVGAPEDSENEAYAPQFALETKKRRGCGCLSGILFVMLALIVLFIGWFIISPDTDVSRHESGEGVYNDMMVNPNLEEELGKEWADEPQVEPQLPTEKDTASALSEEQRDESSISEQKADSVVQKETNPQVPETVATIVDKFCIVRITESLQSKSIKDITPADTTDYIISGTLVTHELKGGETIIQLARRYYGDKRLWPYIVKYNWMKDFNNVAIGQMINIPVLTEKIEE